MVDYNRGYQGNNDRRRSRSPSNRSQGRHNEPPRLVDPFTMKEHVSYDYFCNWYLALNPGAGIDQAMQTRYDEYSQDLLARTARPYVEQHVKEAWFRDLYDDAEHNPALKQQAHALFQAELEKGSYDAFALERVAEGAGYTMGHHVPPSTNEGDISPQILTLSGVPSTISRASLQVYLAGQIGSMEHFSISAARSQDATRTAWIVLRGDANSTEVKAQIHGTEFKEDDRGSYTLDVSHYRRPPQNARTRSLWAQLNELSNLEENSIQLEAICERLDSGTSESSPMHKIKSMTEDDIIRQVDLCVEYLRTVHNFDFWRMEQYDSSMDLQTHSPQYSRLVPGATSNQRAFDTWQQRFDQKVQLYLDPEPVLVKLRVKPPTAALSDAIVAKVKQEDEQRFRCQVLDCTKLFQDFPFVKKHIEKRHGEWIKQVTEEADFLRRYLSDPNKTLPYKHFREARGRQNTSPSRNRRRSPRQRNAGFVSHRAGRVDYRGPPAQNYRDLDRPVEELPELDY